MKVKLGFQNFYLYSAVSPQNGEDFTMILPLVNTVCMNIFLQQMSQHLGSKKALIVMDCASWHKSQSLSVPSNISVMLLPPYSPELNPVERLWRYIKQNTIKNKVFDTLAALEIEISDFINSIQPQTLKSLCSLNYL